MRLTPLAFPLLAAIPTLAVALPDDVPAPAGDAPVPEEPKAPAVPVLKLYQAVAKGLVRARGDRPQSYQKVHLTLRSLAKVPIAIDIAGSHLNVSGGPRCQRLGLGPVTPDDTPKTRKEGAGSIVIDLAPGGETELTVNTCCLDSGLPCPSTASNTYTAAAEPLPDVRISVLRWWADNPTAPQGSVNSAIWQFAPVVNVSPGVVANYVRPAGKFAAVHAGVYYRLTDGELTAVDPEGVVRILGTEIFSAIPTDQGVYVVALGQDRKPKLWLLPVTAENGWKKIADIDGTTRIREVIPASRGKLVLVTDQGVSWCDAEHGTITSVLNETQTFLSVRKDGDARVEVTIRKPPRQPTFQGGERRFEAGPVCELWSVDCATGKAERDDQFWNIGSMLCGDSGIFALSHTQGRLERRSGNRFTDFGPDAVYRRIVAVSREVVWLSDESGRLVALDGKSGAVRFRTEFADDEKRAFDVDPVTGDFAYVDGGAFRRIRAKDGAGETIDPR